MKKSLAKRLAIFFTITLTLSLIGIISYLSSNPAAAKIYFTRNIHHYNRSYMNFDWMDYIPFVNDDLKDFVQDEVNDAIHEGIDIANQQKDNWKDWSNNWRDSMNSWKSSMDSWKNNWKWNNNLPKYTKIGDTIVDHVSSEGIQKMEIVTDISELHFVEENREDIQVEYIYTKPDTSNVFLSYDVEVKGDTLRIEQQMKINNYIGSLDNYQNDIIVHVPEDFVVNQLSYYNDLGRVKDNAFYSKVEELNIHANLGSIDIRLSNEVDNVKLTASAGDIILDNDAEIDNLYMLANAGKIRLNHGGHIRTLIMDADMGTITVDADGVVDYCTLDANMGHIDATFKKEVNGFIINCDMGNINLKLYDNDDTIINSKVGMGNVSSDFAKGSSKDYIVDCAMGNITIKKR